MKIASLFSGGKDSTYATYLCSKENELKYLITIESKNKESYIFHTTNIKITKLLAKAMNIPIIYAKSSGEEKEELIDLEKILEIVKQKGVEAIVSGVIESNYQYSRVNRICDSLGLMHIAPLWKRDAVEILKNIIKDGFEVIITLVAAHGLDASWLGRKIDEDCIIELEKLHEKYKINICGEGGEFETLVLDCPLFNKSIKIESFEKFWDNKTRSGELIIKKARLIEK
ncbi:MAG: TIGR00289 family protein [Candidatus Aenigmatarchaeota archaeon]|nr:TIGR00289 family protein [Candidatus Aenigmarchaeota archaeon]